MFTSRSGRLERILGKTKETFVLYQPKKDSKTNYCTIPKIDTTLLKWIAMVFDLQHREALFMAITTGKVS